MNDHAAGSYETPQIEGYLSLVAHIIVRVQLDGRIDVLVPKQGEERHPRNPGSPLR
jgi:hypothetical protein